MYKALLTSVCPNTVQHPHYLANVPKFAVSASPQRCTDVDDVITFQISHLHYVCTVQRVAAVVRRVVNVQATQLRDVSSVCSSKGNSPSRPFLRIAHIQIVGRRQIPVLMCSAVKMRLQKQH